MAVVFMEDWQHQCCGDPFAEGQAVTWTVRTDVDRARLSQVLGDDLAASVAAIVERHDESVASLAGTVERIRVVFCRYEETSDDPDGVTHRPVVGTTVLRDVQQIEGRRGEWLDEELEWVGYVVDVRT